MAFFTDTLDGRAVVPALMDRIIGFFGRLVAAQNRTDTVEKLQAMSDAELAEIGLARADIFRHVYRDIYYI